MTASEAPSFVCLNGLCYTADLVAVYTTDWVAVYTTDRLWLETVG